MKSSAAAYANYVQEDVDSLFGDTQSPAQPYYEYIPPTLSDIYSDAKISEQVQEYSRLNHIGLTNEQLNSIVETIKNASQDIPVETYNSNFDTLVSDAVSVNTAGNIFGADNSPLPVYSDVYGIFSNSGRNNTNISGVSQTDIPQGNWNNEEARQTLINNNLDRSIEKIGARYLLGGGNIDDYRGRAKRDSNGNFLGYDCSGGVMQSLREATGLHIPPTDQQRIENWRRWYPNATIIYGKINWETLRRTYQR